MTEIRVASSPGEIRIAVTDRDDLLDYALWRPAAPDGTGDIHSGRVSAVSAAQGGAFVTLTGNQTGFLPTRNTLNEGDPVLVRVTRAAQGGKGLRLTRIEGPIPNAPPRLISLGPTPLEALAATYPNAPLLTDASTAARIPATLRPRLQRTPDAFDADLIATCDALEQPDITLPNGMRATITPTPALIAIDLDTAQLTTDTRPKQTAQVAANIAALPMLARQIRLRNLSGAILIDPAGIGIRKRQALLTPMRDALAADPLAPQCLGVTALGLIEILRPRQRPPLHELLTSPHGIALAALRTLLAQHTTTGRPRPLSLHAAIPIIKALEADPDALADFATTYGAPLTLITDPSTPLWRCIP